MAQEGIQLVDTIFYFVDTMEEYTLMLEENKVLSRVIVFVDETQEIYKDGKLFGGYKKAVEKIDLLAEEVRQAMDLSDNDMRLLMRQLRETVWTSFEEEIQLIQTNVATYKDRLDRLREEFDQGYIEQGGVVLNIDELRGVIEEYAYWKTSVEGTLTTFGNIVNAQNATLRTFGERLDTMNYTVTNYEHIVDLKNQEVREYIENYDITNKVRSILGREMLLNDGLLHDFATVTNVNDMVRSSVDVWFNSLEPSWTQLTSWALKGNDAYNDITVMGGINSKITLLGDTVDTMTASVSLFTDWYNGNKEFLAYLKAQSDGNSAFFDLQAQFDANNGNNELVRKAAARIFGYVNSEGSSLLLSADHIQLDGTSFMINADKVRGLGDWVLDNVTVDKFMAQYGNNNIKINALPNDAYGIKASTGGFWLKLDGSGNLANGHITWDSQGNLRINGQAINGGGNVVIIEGVLISDYWSKTEFTPSNYVTTSTLGDLSGLNGGLKAWVLQQIQNAGTQEGQEINVLQIVQTTLENEISRANGPFTNFVKTNNQGKIAGYDIDGYVTKQGLRTDVEGLIYDGQGDLLASGPLYSALSTLNILSGALILNGQVVGAYTQETIESTVNNYINNSSALSSLSTWALSIDSSTSAGFCLQSLVNTVTGNNTQEGASGSVGAYISGLVQDGVSNITISADLINLDGETLFNKMSGTFNYTIHPDPIHPNVTYTVNGDIEFNPSIIHFKSYNSGVLMNESYIKANEIYTSGDLAIDGNIYSNNYTFANYGAEINVPTTINANVDISGTNRTLTITGSGSKLTTQEFWAKHNATFDRNVDLVGANYKLTVEGQSEFKSQVDFKSSVNFTGTNSTITIGSSQSILVYPSGGSPATAFTGTVPAGKSLVVVKGFVIGYTG